MKHSRKLLAAGLIVTGIASIAVSQQAPSGDGGPRRTQAQGRPPRGEGQGGRGPGGQGPGGQARGEGRGGMPGENGGGQGEKIDCEVTVASYNYSPRGEIDGLIVSTHDNNTVQVNFPPPMADKVVKAAEVGAKVRVEAEKFGGSDDHEMWQLRRILTADGKTVAGEEQAESAPAHSDGVVKSLNYNRRGDVDGVVLDNGDFIHLGPGADQMDLKVGSKVAADGNGRAMKRGGKVIEAEKINGEEVNREQPNDRRPPPPAN